MLGFEGALCIHPNQVDICNEVFQPPAEEIVKAQQLIAAFERHQAKGEGVFVADGRMVDAPVVARGRTVLAKAEALARRQA